MNHAEAVDEAMRLNFGSSKVRGPIAVATPPADGNPDGWTVEFDGSSNGKLTLTGVASLLGVKYRSARKYALDVYAEGNPVAIEPFFPHPDRNGLYSVAAVRRWQRKRKGLGGGPGHTKQQTGQPCESCGAVVARRVLDGDDDRLKCRPCFVADGARGSVSG